LDYKREIDMELNNVSNSRPANMDFAREQYDKIYSPEYDDPDEESKEDHEANEADMWYDDKDIED